MKKTTVEIVEAIDTSQVYGELSHEQSGGICVFFGNVREFSNDEEVVWLQFETYTAMAIKEMEKTANEVVIRWDLNKVVVRHVVGTKKVGEPVVVVGASSAHRTACFEACRFLIYLKGKGAYLEKGNF